MTIMSINMSIPFSREDNPTKTTIGIYAPKATRGA